MFDIDTRDNLTGGILAPAATLAALRRILTPERILLAMTEARGFYATVALPKGVQPHAATYSDVIWAQPESIDELTARAATHAESNTLPLGTDTLPLKSIHWQMDWESRTPDGVRLEYRLVVRLAPRYREGHRPDVGAMSLTGELTQRPILPPGLTDTALAPKYRAASLGFSARRKA
jgi:hypothetical protein